MLKVTIYTRQDCKECVRVWEMLSPIATRDNFELVQASSPEGAPAPCIRFSAPGSPFYPADGLTEAQFQGYLKAAQHSLTIDATPGTRGAKAKRRAGSAPDADFERSHPVRSFFWRHRVGAIVSGLSVFLGAAWVAPLTTTWGWGDDFYNAVHRVYQLVCDQIPERSAQVGGLPVCLCWRCTAIYAGALFFGILYTLGRDGKLGNLNMNWLNRPISLAIMLLFGLPLILDGMSHAFGLRTGIEYAQSSDFWLSWAPFSADWWLRVGTSLLATVGAVKFLCPRLDKMGGVYERLRAARTIRRPETDATAQSVSQGRLPSG